MNKYVWLVYERPILEQPHYSSFWNYYHDDPDPPRYETHREKVKRNIAVHNVENSDMIIQSGSFYRNFRVEEIYG